MYFISSFCIGLVIGSMVICLKKRNTFEMDIILEEDSNDNEPDAMA